MLVPPTPPFVIPISSPLRLNKPPPELPFVI